MDSEKVCIVCGSKGEFKIIWKKKRHHPTYYLCLHCRLVFAYPQEDKKFKEIPMTPITKDEIIFRTNNYNYRYRKIENHLSKEKPKVLDIGCQNGIFLNYMKNKGCKTLGIEPSLEYAKYARKSFGVNIIDGLFEEKEIKAGFDLITMFNVLEHSKNPREFLIKVFKLLEKEGLLVLELPYIFTPQSVLSLGYWHHFEKDHNWFFNKKNIDRLLKELGFNVISICFIPKIAPLSRLLDGLFARTIYMFMTRDSYFRFRNTFFYEMLNRICIKINIMDYILVIAKK